MSQAATTEVLRRDYTMVFHGNTIVADFTSVERARQYVNMSASHQALIDALARFVHLVEIDVILTKDEGREELIEALANGNDALSKARETA